MTQGDGFKHITVTAAEEEDVIIEAGLAAVSAQDGMAAAETAPRVPEARPAGIQPAESRADDAPSGATSRAADRAVRTHGPSRQDSRTGTSLEDLDPSPMPFTQKIVIGAALVLIVAALVYYFMAMR